MYNWFIVLNKDVSKQKSSLKRPPVCDWVHILDLYGDILLP